MKSVYAAIGVIIAVLLFFTISNASKVGDLKDKNNDLKDKVSQLQKKNDELETNLMNAQKENDKESAESVAVDFVKILNDASMNIDRKKEKIKPLLTKELFEEKFNVEEKKDEHKDKPITEVKINRALTSKVNDQTLVTVEYDRVVKVNGQSFTERFTINFEMTIENAKWLIKKYEMIYEEGQEGSGHQ
ncbi:hypothetical protein [Bacillus cereus group sp. N21]|uniref:hypothetical protein n=1 Tax=Bacillus cereus group sp. N21 TaxID=2794591 RepID=UPI0018F6138C|nr:hypothetical protein [Bacillus cereus group sp. N21]MBJ8031264.1 hypothetical protein [Bacillus cereus group sp. N21]